jgi:hypothetical protein
MARSAVGGEERNRDTRREVARDLRTIARNFETGIKERF